MEKLNELLLGLFRLVIFIVYLVFYFLSAMIFYFSTQDMETRKRRVAANGVFWCRLCCKTFGIEVRVKNKPSENISGLVVGNHLGFVDIVALASIMPNLFVTSREMRETPLLGQITELAGCIYVERRNRGKIEDELKEMISYLKKGFRITLYPEATSHNGEEILPFKRTLLTAAAHAGVPIYPVVFNFITINGEPFQMKYRDRVCYWGDITFYHALWGMGTLRKIVCEIEYLSPVYPKITDDRGAVADGIRDQIVQKFKPVQK